MLLATLKQIELHFIFITMLVGRRYETGSFLAKLISIVVAMVRLNTVCYSGTQTVERLYSAHPWDMSKCPGVSSFHGWIFIKHIYIGDIFNTGVSAFQGFRLEGFHCICVSPILLLSPETLLEKSVIS